MQSPNSSKPKSDGSIGGGRALREGLASVVPVYRVIYRRHTFVGLSSLPGNGLEEVELVRLGDRMVGSVKIELRGLGSQIATCAAPLELEANRVDVLMQSLPSAEVTFGAAGFVTLDSTEQRTLQFEALNGRKVAFLMGPGTPCDFWGFLSEDEPVSVGDDRPGVLSAALSEPRLLLDDACAIPAQSEALWKILKDWQVLRRSE